METKDAVNVLKLRDKYGDDHFFDTLNKMKGAVIPKSMSGEEPLTPDQLANQDQPMTSTMSNAIDTPIAPKDPTSQFMPLSESGLPPLTPNELRTFSVKGSEQVQPTTPDKEEPTSEQSVAKSPITGKASIVNNALEKKAPEIAPVSPKEDEFQKQLDAAHQKDAEHQLMFGMLKAAQMGGGALAGSKIDTGFADTELQKDKAFANQLKTDMDVKQEHQKIMDEQSLRDKSSPLYKLTNEMYKKAFGTNLPEGVTPLQLKAMGLDIDNLNKAIINKEVRAEDRALKMAQIDALKADKAEKLKAKDSNAYATFLSNQVKSRFGPAASALNQIQRGESLNEMFNALPKKSDGSIDFATATKAHKEELVKAIDTMLSGGKSTISGSEHLRKAYNTAYDKLADIRQLVATDKLPSLNQQHVIEQMYDLMKRETNVARFQAARYLDASGSKAFHSLSPQEKREQIQQLTGVSPEEMELINNHKVDLSTMMELKNRGLNPSEVLSSIKGGKSAKDIVSQPIQIPQKSTTINSGVVTIRSKKTGTTKTLPAESAAKYLNSPDFERVQ